MAKNPQRPTRPMDVMFEVPHGEDLATFDNYPDAQALVNTLVGEGVSARALSIVGKDVTLVERVTGKIGHGRAALSSAISGSWIGAVAGLVVVLVDPSDVITPVLAGLLIGAGAGMVVGMLLFTFSIRHKKLYRSIHNVIALTYRVVVASTEFAHATEVLAKNAATSSRSPHG